MTDGGRRCADYATSPYPGEIPNGPFMITGGRVVPFDHSGVHSVEVFGPVPLLTYGSNACPGRLAEKFSPDLASVAELSGIAVVPAVALGVEAVWACSINSRDAVPRTLAGVAGASLDCHVLLLPRSLLPRMDKTEGRGGRFYVAARLQDVTAVLANGFRWVEPVTYLGVGRRGPLCHRGGVLLCREHSEQDARDLIEAQAGGCDDAWLPSYREIPIEVAISELAAPPVDRFL